MPDTHDDGRVPLRQRSIPDQLDHFGDKLGGLLDGAKLDRDTLTVIGAAVVNLGAIAAQLRKQADQLAAATARAEKAEVAELSLLRLEWSTANCYSDLGDDIVSERLARDRVASRPEIHAAVVSRQIYAGPWREGACRSCGTDERVVGDPPLCSNCAVYGATYRGVACWPPVASPDGLSEPVERSETSGGSFQVNTSSITPQGLSEAEGGCPWCGTLQKLDADGLVLPHEHPTYCDECPGSTRRPNNDTPEDGQHG